MLPIVSSSHADGISLLSSKASRSTFVDPALACRLSDSFLWLDFT